jgi:ABC-2 type transport system ATP-binding protein
VGEAIAVAGLTKRYGTKAVLDDVDLRVARGTVCAVLGPNGAGKTTAVRVMTTLIRPDAGQVEVAGIDVIRHPGPLRATAPPRPPGRRSPGRRTPEQVGLTDTGTQPVRQFSGGMRRRLDIAAGLVLAPEVLFLDEPTTGLDPAGRRDVWDAVRALVAGGTTVLLTTQYLEEAERLADDVCVLDAGRVVARGTPRELTAAIGGDGLELVVPDREQARHAALVAERVAGAGPGAEPPGGGERVVVPVARRRGVVGAVVRALDDAGITVDDVVLRPTTLDEAYLRITGADRTEVRA